MLTYLTISATLVIGLARGPWWCWLISGAALAFLTITDPRHLRPTLSEAPLTEALAVLRSDLTYVSVSCTIAAVAFAAGRVMSWALPI
jgi:hypothetical protein